jgi:hypothetical protein
LEQTGRLSRAVIWGLSPASFAKIFLFALHPNQIHIQSHPALLEGRIAIVTDAGWDAMDAGGASDEGAGLRTAKSCGPDASTLAFKSAQETAPATVTNKPDHRGEREGNR